MAQAVVSFINHDWPEVALWLVATAAIVLLAGLAEIVKRPEGD